MTNSSLENCSIHISKGWIIGCSILTIGMITSAYINSMTNISLLKMKQKYKEEMKLLIY
jgi:hypothetical protein